MNKSKLIFAATVCLILVAGIIFSGNQDIDTGTSKYIVVVPLTHKYAESLTGCKKYKRTYRNSDGGVAGVYEQTLEIKGWKGGKCSLNYKIKHSLSANGLSEKCLVPANTVKNTGKMYKEILNGTYTADTSTQGFFNALAEARGESISQDEQIENILDSTWNNITQMYCN